MATAHILNPDRSNGFQQRVPDRMQGTLSNKDKTYSFGPIPPPPRISDVATKSVRHWCRASGLAKVDPFRQLMTVKPERTLVCNHKRYPVSVGDSNPQVTQMAIFTLHEAATKKEREKLQQISARLDKYEVDLRKAKEKQPAKKESAPPAAQDPLQAYDDAMDGLRKELGRRIDLVEAEARALIDTMKEDTKKVQLVNRFQQLLTKMMTTEGANGGVDFSNNPEMVELVRKLSEFGIVFHEGTKWNAEQAAAARSNADIFKTSALQTTKEQQAEVQRWNEMLHQLHMMRAMLVTKRGSTAETIIRGIGRSGG